MILDDVGAHLEGLLSDGFGVFVYVGVFPAVAQVAFVGVETDEAAFVKYSEALRGFVVVFVDFGEAVVELEFLVVDLVCEGQLDELSFWKYLFHGGA